MHHLGNLTITSNSSQPFTDQRPTPFHAGVLPQISEQTNINLSPVVNFEDQSHSLKLQNLQHGKVVSCKRLDFQAHSSSIASKDDVNLVLNAIHKFTRADAYAFAFRINADQINQVGQLQEEAGLKEEPLILEGCEDGLTEKGAGLKILNLLRKMGAQNLVVIVSIKETSFKRFQPHILPNEVLRMIGERAKELILVVYDSVLTEEQKVQLKTGQNFFLKTESVKTSNKDQFSLIQTTPWQSGHLKHAEPFNSSMGFKRKYDLSNTVTPADVWELYYSEFNDLQYQHKVKRLFKVAYKIKKPMLLDLIAYSAPPHPAVQQVLKLYCMLRGVLHSNWKIMKEALNPVKFRIEFLRLTQMFKDLPDDRIVYIAKQLHSNKLLEPVFVGSIDAAAGVLAEWLHCLVISFCGRNKFRDVHVMSDDEEEPVKEDPRAKIKPFGETKYTYGLRKKTKKEIEDQIKAIEEEEQEEDEQRNQMEELFFSPHSGAVKKLNNDLFKSTFDTSKFMREIRSHTNYRTSIPQIYKQYKEAVRKRSIENGKFLQSKQMVFGKREDPYHDPSSMLMPQQSIISYESQTKMRASSIDGSQRNKLRSEGKASIMSQSINLSPRPSQTIGSRAAQRGQELKSAALSVLNENDEEAFNHPRFNEIYNYKAMEDVVANFPSGFNDIIKGNKNALDINQIPEDEEGALNLSKIVNLEDQNIEVLQAFAARMKAKRLRLFPLKDKSTWDVVD